LDAGTPLLDARNIHPGFMLSPAPQAQADIDLRKQDVQTPGRFAVQVRLGKLSCVEIRARKLF
jgi:hypothetical protein